MHLLTDYVEQLDIFFPNSSTVFFCFVFVFVFLYIHISVHCEFSIYIVNIFYVFSLLSVLSQQYVSSLLLSECDSGWPVADGFSKHSVASSATVL